MSAWLLNDSHCGQAKVGSYQSSDHVQKETSCSGHPKEADLDIWDGFPFAAKDTSKNVHMAPPFLDPGSPGKLKLSLPPGLSRMSCSMSAEELLLRLDDGSTTAGSGLSEAFDFGDELSDAWSAQEHETESEEEEAGAQEEAEFSLDGRLASMKRWRRFQALREESSAGSAMSTSCSLRTCGEPPAAKLDTSISENFATQGAQQSLEFQRKADAYLSRLLLPPGLSRRPCTMTTAEPPQQTDKGATLVGSPLLETFDSSDELDEAWARRFPASREGTEAAGSCAKRAAERFESVPEADSINHFLGPQDILRLPLPPGLSRMPCAMTTPEPSLQTEEGKRQLPIPTGFRRIPCAISTAQAPLETDEETILVGTPLSEAFDSSEQLDDDAWTRRLPASGDGTEATGPLSTIPPSCIMQGGEVAPVAVLDTSVPERCDTPILPQSMMSLPEAHFDSNSFLESRPKLPLPPGLSRTHFAIAASASVTSFLAHTHGGDQPATPQHTPISVRFDARTPQSVESVAEDLSSETAPKLAPGSTRMGCTLGLDFNFVNISAPTLVQALPGLENRIRLLSKWALGVDAWQDLLEPELDDPEWQMLALMGAGFLAGFATYAFFPEACEDGSEGLIMSVHHVVVDEVLRGMGYGRAMLERLLEIAHSANAWSVKLHSAPASVGFYERMGFKLAGPERLMEMRL